MNRLIKKPLITEKNTFHGEKGIYVFEVDSDASKTDIRAAIEKSFQVKVDSINTSNCRGRARRNKFGMGKVPYWKKAYVKLKAGEKIALFEGV